MAMKPLKTEFQEKEISLECTHKAEFPPPQMYGHTAEDVDKMWKQGAIDQTMHQKLTIWKNMCGLFQMGAKCMGCEQALLQKPRPGRPKVIETENWLKAKRQMELDLQRENRIRPEDRPAPEPLPERPAKVPQKPRIVSGNQNLGLAGIAAQQEFVAATEEEAKAMAELEAKIEAEVREKIAAEEAAKESPEPEKAEETLDDETVPEKPEEPADEPIETPDEEGVDDDLIAALADD